MKHVLAAMAIVALLAGCQRAEPILAVSQQPVPQGLMQKLAPGGYDKLYAEAALSKGWRPEQVEPGRIRASITIRGTHSLTVDIVYNSAIYDIGVVSSENLNQADGKIHPAANTAIRGLRDAIDAALSRAAF